MYISSAVTIASPVRPTLRKRKYMHAPARQAGRRLTRGGSEGLQTISPSLWSSWSVLMLYSVAVSRHNESYWQTKALQWK